jgi:hypothetical protein
MSGSTLNLRAKALYAEVATSNSRDAALIVLENALREQDKLTRHACADAVNSLYDIGVPKGPTESLVAQTAKTILSAAHAQCINASAV